MRGVLDLQPPACALSTLAERWCGSASRRRRGSDQSLHTRGCHDARQTLCAPQRELAASPRTLCGRCVQAPGGYETIVQHCKKLEKKHAVHIAAYGEGNERRLTGKHEVRGCAGAAAVLMTEAAHRVAAAVSIAAVAMVTLVHTCAVHRLRASRERGPGRVPLNMRACRRRA